MSTYSLTLNQTISNPVLFDNGRPNGGIIIQLGDTPLGGPSSGNRSVGDIDIKINTDTLNLSNSLYEPEFTLPNKGNIVNDKVNTMNLQVSGGVLNNNYKAIVLNNVGRNESLGIGSPGYLSADPTSSRNCLFILGGVNNVEQKITINYPTAWTNFIANPSIFHRFYKRRICWSVTGGYFYWEFETITNAPVCPA